MSKRMLIDAVQEDEQRVVVLENDTLLEADFFSAQKAQIKGNVYLARVTRVEPSLQAAFVDFGNGKHGFLPFSEIHPDYFQIPVADREALLEKVQQSLDSRQTLAEEEQDSQTEALDDEAAAGDAVDSEAVEAETDKPAPKPKRTRKTKAQKEAEAAALAESEDSIPEETPVAAKPKRTRKTKAQKEAEAAALAESEDSIPEETPVIAKPKRTRKTKAQKEAEALAEAEAEAANAETPAPNAEELTEEAPAPKKARSPRKRAVKKTVEAEASPPESAAAPDTPEEPVKKPRGRPRKKPVAAMVEEEVVFALEETSVEPTTEVASEPTAEEALPTKSRSRRRTTRSSSGTRTTSKNSENKGRSRPARRRDDELDDLSDADFEARSMTRAILARKYKIQEVIKRNQVILVQAAKEERGDKGAALTTYLSLPGRYCVLMPNTHRGGGISRRIASSSDRKRLKSVLDELEIAPNMSLIVRTAGAERTKEEITRDFAYLTHTWDQIRETTLNSFAPTLVYEEANLIKRAIRDIYESDTDEVLVAGEEAHKAAKAFMETLTPTHASRVQLYTDETPLFQAHGVEGMLETLHRPTVRLPSGGYLVLNQTEALVAIDVNSGKATKERNIEETALKTNIEAAREAARQLRLRDLAGLVVIDFIDMEENRNVSSVERTLKEALKPDRARIQVGRISQFGLMELSRQRLRPSVAEATMTSCPTCLGTGFTRSDSANGRSILRQLEEHLMSGRCTAITVLAGHELALSILNEHRANLQRLEESYGVPISVKIDPLIGPTLYRCVIDRDGRFESFGNETATPDNQRPRGKGRAKGNPRRDRKDASERSAREPRAPREPREKREPREPRNDQEQPGEEPVTNEAGDQDDESERKRRRRGKRGGRRRGKRDDEAVQENAETGVTPDFSAPGAPQPTVESAPTSEVEDAPKPKRKRASPRKKAEVEADDAAASQTNVDAAPKSATPPPAPAPAASEATKPVDTPANPDAPKKRGWWNRVTGQ